MRTSTADAQRIFRLCNFETGANPDFVWKSDHPRDATASNRNTARKADGKNMPAEFFEKFAARNANEI